MSQFRTSTTSKATRAWAGSAVLVAALVAGCTAAQGSAPRPAAPTGSSTAASSGDGPVGDSYAARQMRDVMGCLGEGGWKVNYSVEAGGFETDVPIDQREAFLAAKTACESTFEAAHPLRPLTEADYRDLYRQELATATCLAKAGYPPNEAPISEQQYVEDYKAGRAPSWQAYRAASLGSAEALVELEKKCPQPFVDQEIKK